MTEERKKQSKRVSIDLRGKNAEYFEEFRKWLSEDLGFEVAPSRAVLWAVKRTMPLEE